MKVNTEKSVGSHGNGNNSEATNGCSKRGKHDANLQKNGFLRFQIGLITALALVYLAVELSTVQKDSIVVADEDTTEEATLEFYPELATIKIKRPKTDQMILKKAVNPTEFIIKDDVVDVDPTDVVDSNPVDPEPLGIDEIEHIDTPPEEIMDFRVVEDPPIFPGCEKVDKKDRFECFNKKMTKHIRKHFRYPDAAIEMGQQGRVSVLFRIGSEGVIEDVQMRGPSKILEKEAARIIGKLPKMTPGKQRGRAVKVPFSVPINFRLD